MNTNFYERTLDPRTRGGYLVALRARPLLRDGLTLARREARGAPAPHRVSHPPGPNSSARSAPRAGRARVARARPVRVRARDRVRDEPELPDLDLARDRLRRRHAARARVQLLARRNAGTRAADPLRPGARGRGLARPELSRERRALRRAALRLHGGHAAGWPHLSLRGDLGGPRELPPRGRVRDRRTEPRGESRRGPRRPDDRQRELLPRLLVDRDRSGRSGAQRARVAAGDGALARERQRPHLLASVPLEAARHERRTRPA